MRKRVFITGGSSGIGSACALMFAKNGWDVVFTYHRNREKAEEVAAECLLHDGLVEIVSLDVRNPKSIDQCYDQVIRQGKSIDVLINNAGVLIKKPSYMQSSEEIKLQVDTNLTGVMLMTNRFLEMVSSMIINIGSDVVAKPKPEIGPYCASKTGLFTYTSCLAREIALRGDAIKIVTVNPRLTRTSMHPGIQEGDLPELVAQKIYRIATGNILVENGASVNVWD